MLCLEVAEKHFKLSHWQSQILVHRLFAQVNDWVLLFGRASIYDGAFRVFWFFVVSFGDFDHGDHWSVQHRLCIVINPNHTIYWLKRNVVLGLWHVDPAHDIYLHIVKINRQTRILPLLFIRVILNQGSLLLFQRLFDTWCLYFYAAEEAWNLCLQLRDQLSFNHFLLKVGLRIVSFYWQHIDDWETFFESAVFVWADQILLVDLLALFRLFVSRWFWCQCFLCLIVLS